MEREYLHQVIEAAFLHTKVDCFFVGTYAQRVSFASQQYRALDLVTGLALIGKLHNASELNVAVVGAGLAGLMAAAALRSYGCQVHVFEGGKEILGRQSNADHRLIHPSIALWPQEAPQPSTNLPVFDWCAATCSKIIRNIKDEWNESFAPYICEKDNPSDRGLKVTLNAPITDYTKNFSARNGRLRCDGTPEWLSDLSFDLVIVATGYGIENVEAEKDSISYWHPNPFIDKRDEAFKSKDGKLRFYISGCGDGGLIEALRLVHGDFLNGWLTVVVAEALSGTKIAEEIRKAEQQALMWARSIVARDPENASAAYSDSAVARHLQMVYLEQASKLRSPPPEDENQSAYAHVNELLTCSLNKIKLNGRVFLVSPLDAPFGPNSAPIHKLLVAHALLENRLEYRKGRYHSDGTTSWIESEFAKVVSDENTILVPRHGSETARTNIIDPREQQSLRLRQIMLADRLEVNKARQLCPDTEISKDLGRRLPHVRAMFEEIDDRYVVDASGDEYSYTLTQPDAPPNNNCVASLGDGRYGVDRITSLFGGVLVRASEGGVDEYDA